MGLLDGINSLQGAPPPNPSLSKPMASASEPAGQLPPGERGFFFDFGSRFQETFSPAITNINETARTSVTSLRRLMGDETVEDLEAPPPPPAQMSLSEEMSSMFNLTLFQRIALFAMCFGTGVFLIGMSFTFLPMIVLAPHKFAASFTMGNVLAIVSTWILVGPRAQLQSMFSPVRAVAASIYVVSLLVTLCAAFFGGKLRYIIVFAALIAEIASCKLQLLSYFA